MDFILQRYSDNGKSTQGILLEKALPKPLFFSHLLEDEHRDVKLAHETRIWAGTYPLKIREEETPLTIVHREFYNKGEKYPWFEYHIEVVGVKGFTGVYFHSGNKEKDTDACLLPNDTANNNTIEEIGMSRSTQAVKRFYQKVYPHLKAGGQAFIEIRDEDYLIKK